MKRFGIFCDRVIYVFAFCILLIILVGNAAVTAHVSYDEAEINCLQRCTAAENFTMQGEILFESVMVECKAIRLIQKMPKGFPLGGSCPRSGLMRAKLPQPPIYE